MMDGLGLRGGRDRGRRRDEGRILEARRTHGGGVCWCRRARDGCGARGGCGGRGDCLIGDRREVDFFYILPLLLKKIL